MLCQCTRQILKEKLLSTHPTSGRINELICSIGETGEGADGFSKNQIKNHAKDST